MIPFYEPQIARMRVLSRSNLEFPVHLHNATEIIYVKEGVLNLIIDDQDCELPSGSMAVIFPNLIHGYYTAPGNTSETLIVTCEAELLPDFAQILFKHVPAKPILPLSELHPDVIYALQRMEEDRHVEQNISIPKAFLQLVLGHTFPHIDLIPIQADANPDLAKRLLSHIALHFQEPLSLDSLAKIFGTNKYQISRIFSKTLHISFNEYVNRIRLDYASKLIRTTNNTMIYICLESGFDNQHTFNRVFRQYYNMTPNEYRRK